MLNCAKVIKNLRNENSYTQEQLANICGVTRQAVAKWEAGANIPDAEKLLQLARLFHTSVDAILTGDTVSARKNDAAISESDSLQNEKIVNQALQKAMSCKDPDEEIFEFISFIGDKIGCDRMYFFEQNPDSSYKNTYEWCGKGITPQIEYLQNIPLEDMSIWLNAFSQNDYVFIEDIDIISETEPAVYRWLKPQDIRSILVCPLFGGRSFLGVDNPAQAFISQTSSLMGIMIHFAETMLQRRDLVRELKWTAFQNDLFSRLSKGVRYQINVVTGNVQCDQERLKALGYSFTADTVSQLEAVIALHPECHDHLMIDGIRRAIETKENLSIEFISYNKERTIRWNRLSISPFLDHEGTVLQLYGLLQDVSAEHQIIEQYNRYISHLSGGLHICYLSRPIHLEYASDDLCEFLGYSRDEFEQFVSSRYTNIIVEEDRAAFTGYAQRLAAAPKIESCEYRIRKKDGTVVQVIDTMESVRDSNGIMYGYAYVMAKSEMHAMLEMADENEKRHLAIIDRQYEVLDALGKDYLNVFRVWLDEDRAQIVKLYGYVTKGMNRESAELFPYYRFCKQYIQDRVHPDDQQKMMAAMHPDTVREAFAKEDEYIVVYRAVDHGETHFYQLKYTRLNDPEKDGKINFVAGFKNIDRVIEEEHAKNEQLQSRLNIINAILQAFACGYYYSYQDDTFVELSNNDPVIGNLIGKGGSFTENRERMIQQFPDREVFDSIDSFLDPGTLAKRLGGRKSISAQIFFRGHGWYEIYIFVVDHDKNGNIAHYIFAARDITKEREQEEEYIRSLGISNRREREAMLFAFRDTLTGVMNRNAFERDFRTIESGRQLGVIFCDVNKLKMINDTQGHNRGDQYLKAYAELMKKHFSVDCIYRIGGDEFVCVIEDVGKTGFSERVKVFLQEVEECGSPASVGSSYGDSGDKESLLKAAESAMYAMKSGTGRVG